MKEFRNKIAVITGAASGFGREFAHAGARLGMKLVLADVQQDALDKTANELEAQGAQVLAMRCDVRKAEQMQALADATMDRFGAVHLLFNNAGVGTGGLIWENSVADWEWVLGVNLWGVIHGVRIFTPLMLECAKKEQAYRGHIVNTASMAGLLNAPNMGIYNVSKHAVVSLSETLYHDLQLIDAPIGASVLCPYFVPTGISQSQRNRPDDVKEEMSPTASQRAAQVLAEKAVSSGKVSAAQVAEQAFDAIRDGRFYIYSHPQALDGVQTRMEDIVLQRNPSDPYAAAPQIREMLRATLRAGDGRVSRRLVLGDWNHVKPGAQAVRLDVFVAEQGVPLEMEWDDMDARCLHALVLDEEGEAIATGRLLPDGHIGRMAVRKSLRGLGIGTMMLQALMNAAKQRGDRAVLLSAQMHAVPFYARHGFVREGDEFMDAGIPHVQMRRDFERDAA